MLHLWWSQDSKIPKIPKIPRFLESWNLGTTTSAATGSRGSSCCTSGGLICRGRGRHPGPPLVQQLAAVGPVAALVVVARFPDSQDPKIPRFQDSKIPPRNKPFLPITARRIPGRSLPSCQMCIRHGTSTTPGSISDTCQRQAVCSKIPKRQSSQCTIPPRE